ncbi:hypothetical protein JY97_05665 [Alkalispirochaeta odontotermitis]|nr:hypothetical protein JY97_05665 [Alkalispirochaeta odontotermitis]CAB1081254.1 hypothetical protein D1AOALGA4SA_8910 [Olavius algarvensis Delta 1 endosymbiont]
MVQGAEGKGRSAVDKAREGQKVRRSEGEKVRRWEGERSSSRENERRRACDFMVSVITVGKLTDLVRVVKR